MDQDIINSFKTKYRRHLVNKFLTAIENREELKDIQINVKEAIDMAFQAWQEVTLTTIANCFKKAGFVKDQTQEDHPQAEEDVEPAIDRNLWDNLQNDLGFTVEFEDYVSCDSAVVSTEHMDENSIVESVLSSASTSTCSVKPELKKENITEDDEDEEPSNPFIPANTTECLQYIAGIRQFLQGTHLPGNLFNMLTALEDHTIHHQIARKK